MFYLTMFGVGSRRTVWTIARSDRWNHWWAACADTSSYARREGMRRITHDTPLLSWNTLIIHRQSPAFHWQSWYASFAGKPTLPKKSVQDLIEENRTCDLMVQDTVDYTYMCTVTIHDHYRVWTGKYVVYYLLCASVTPNDGCPRLPPIFSPALLFALPRCCFLLLPVASPTHTHTRFICVLLAQLLGKPDGLLLTALSKVVNPRHANVRIPSTFIYSMYFLRVMLWMWRTTLRHISVMVHFSHGALHAFKIRYSRACRLFFVWLSLS